MKCCVITGTRAEYGLLFWLMKEIEQSPELELQVIATGMHLSPEFGLTYKEIEKEFSITDKIETLLSSDTPIGISKSMGLGMISFSESFDRLKPDLIVVLGDRFEIFSAVSAAMIARIPVAHLHGGEATEGLIDEPIRHSITKMSHLHFTATEEYKKRVIQLGEQPENVFNVGGLGIDNIIKLKLLSKMELETALNFKLAEQTFLITFHPVTLENSTARNQFDNLLLAINEFPDAKFIFTKSNADTEGRVINERIDEFVKSKPDKAISVFSMGQLNYLSSLQYVSAVIGNSSSGLAEAPSFKVPTINIGDRQKGRIKALSVISCEPDKKSIVDAVKMAHSMDFIESLKTVKNPYGEGGASKKIVGVIKKRNLNNILKKKFYDL